MRKLSLRVAHAAGGNAARDGGHPEDNPYRDGTPQRLAWEQGYEAQLQFRREMRAFAAQTRHRRGGTRSGAGREREEGRSKLGEECDTP